MRRSARAGCGSSSSRLSRYPPLGARRAATPQLSPETRKKDVLPCSKRAQERVDDDGDPYDSVWRNGAG
eukprot:5854095-Prymnesium_polylepis.1